MSAELSESQHHWFSGLVASGRHRMALESLARWMAESHTPIPSQAVDEAIWLASSLKIEREVRPVLDAQVVARDDPVGQTTAPSTGFDVPLGDFTQLVSEAVDSLPPAFGQAMTNVTIVIEEENQNVDRFGHTTGTRWRRLAIARGYCTPTRSRSTERRSVNTATAATRSRPRSMGSSSTRSRATSGSMTRGCVSWAGRQLVLPGDPDRGQTRPRRPPAERIPRHPVARTLATS